MNETEESSVKDERDKNRKGREGGREERNKEWRGEVTKEERDFYLTGRFQFRNANCWSWLFALKE